ncbi:MULTISPECIES: FKBP-type peptidyl-prolyl cis-trans isomerase [unclassified Flavobacterium]|uniref:FKBP-type peptidyl-prolyl cis-trans isomerase n=1 Tax=unclassified Flavobacterium TaxID=196869 RepID=UPI0036091708
MSRFFKTILVVTAGLFVFSCNKDDDSNGAKPEPYDVQYKKDSTSIREYMNNHFMKVDPVTFEVEFTRIKTHGPDSLPIFKQTEYPIDSLVVDNLVHKVKYKVYYVKFRQGTGTNPSRVDSTLVSYRGEYLYKKKVAKGTSPETYDEFITGQQFDQAQNPIWFSLDQVVDGWKEMLPLFKSGTYSHDSGTGVISYDNFGAGIFFLPSGLGYYSSSGTIPSYSPMVFSVQLKHINRVDHDFDGIDSYLEDLNGDGKFKVVEGVDANTVDDDTDDDGRPDYRDFDDDGDSYSTKEERPNGVSIDTDSDGKPNYLDNDDDNDGLISAEEKWGDEDNDGIKNYMDPDTVIRR